MEQEPFEIRVEVALQSFVARGENGNIVTAHGVFEFLEEESFLDELRELGVTRVEESDED